MLYSFGTIQFEVSPLNIHELDHVTETDWARKEIAGAGVYREWVGEGDEVVTLRGRIFPHRLGGLTELEVIDSFRRAGQAELLQRGDGKNLGWYVIERFACTHRFLGADGVGQQIQFEATFARCPVPDADEYFPFLYRLIR